AIRTPPPPPPYIAAAVRGIVLTTQPFFPLCLLLKNTCLLDLPHPVLKLSATCYTVDSRYRCWQVQVGAGVCLFLPTTERAASFQSTGSAPNRRRGVFHPPLEFL
ncbi:unnamed protein product, partial [Ectocarpus fasciculatus]